MGSGVARVLDLGCGSGEFGEVLWQRRPELRYWGVDLASANIEAARTRMLLLGCERHAFDCCDGWQLVLDADARGGTAAEAGEAGEAWDFVVSVGCIFSHCDMTQTGLEEQLQFLDAIERTAPRGFLLICHGAEGGQGLCMEAARARVDGYAARSTLAGVECQHYTDSPNGRGRRPGGHGMRALRFKHRVVMLRR
eukprot:NODE_3230_length_813_cov_183.226913.p1 GENE.NODE_3230_length_813_cov_183.226913~~NODE_3230_length_813_cov_183.226913.p1  ORF type:complete len:195 (-),score=59.72 NODE_3230_length_813_cov_183.226913:192-776(-)